MKVLEVKNLFFFLFFFGKWLLWITVALALNALAKKKKNFLCVNAGQGIGSFHETISIFFFRQIRLGG